MKEKVLIDSVKLSDKELININQFIESTGKIVNDGKLPLRFSHKTGTLLIEFFITRHNEGIK